MGLSTRQWNNFVFSHQFRKVVRWRKTCMRLFPELRVSTTRCKQTLLCDVIVCAKSILNHVFVFIYCVVSYRWC